MASMEAIEGIKMTKNLKEAIDVINEMLKYGTHRGECRFDTPSGACSKHVNAARRREKKAIKFMVAQGFAPGSKL
jgi:hypothetical protein